MDAAIRECLGESAEKEGLEKLLAGPFPIGSADAVSKRVVGSLRSGKKEELVRVLLECRQSKEKFAEWVFAYADRDSKGWITEEDIEQMCTEMESMTGISRACSEAPRKKKITKQQFIAMCRSSERFGVSWNTLRAHTKI